jgi:DNA helicase II / ATP-dependent DNA helicase PcrA
LATLFGFPVLNFNSASQSTQTFGLLNPKINFVKGLGAHRLCADITNFECTDIDMTKKNDLTKLNARQRRAVQYGLKNGPPPDIHPLLVIAGAGTGKTNILAHRVAYMIEKGMDPRRILLLTFSRRAADEMTERVKRIAETALGGQQVDLPWSGTFHAVAAKLIWEHAVKFGLSSSFTILDRGDAADLMHLVRHDLGLSAQESPFPPKDICLAIYSFAVNSGLPLSRVISRRFRSCRKWKRELGELFRGYRRAKRRQHVLDYDDLLLYWVKMMSDPAIRAKIRGRFDHVLVDEYQDTNPLQAKILFMVKPKGRGLTVVGDDAQAIYSFRAATIRNILDFPNQCDPKAKIITIEQNYRSTQPILEAANKVIGLAKERYPKNLFSKRPSQQKPYLTTVADERTQARNVAQQIVDSREAGIPLRAQAVLFRVSDHSAELELELTRRNIPFVKYGGAKFLEAAHIKDIVCALRWCENPKDRVAGFRTLQLLPGIGAGTAAKVLKNVDGRRQLAKVLKRLEVPRVATEHWRGLVGLVREMHKSKTTWPAEFQSIRKWYEPLLHHNYDDDADRRLPDIAQLEQIAASYASRRSFLTDLALDPPDGTSGRTEEDDYLILSTIHSAKGQEWRSVRVLNVSDGCIPSGQAGDVEEERRLLHVAMTRAKRELDLIVPQRLAQYHSSKLAKQGGYGTVSRFIPPGTRDAFDCRTWRDRPPLG